MFKRLKEKRFRDTFVAGEIRRLLPFQLRALRAAREWTQGELGERANMPQTVISRIENGNAGSLNIKTLVKLAAAFDVALVIRFEPIDRLLSWVDNLSPERMAPRQSAEILAEMERSATQDRALAVSQTPAFTVLDSGSISTSALVQRTLPLNAPRLVAKNDRTTTATPLAGSSATPSAYQATA
jgi:transcriptional regulator with XRE-family HTH domain